MTGSAIERTDLGQRNLVRALVHASAGGSRPRMDAFAFCDDEMPRECPGINRVGEGGPSLRAVIDLPLEAAVRRGLDRKRFVGRSRATGGPSGGTDRPEAGLRNRGPHAGANRRPSQEGLPGRMAGPTP
jgi:hypothetical protein